MPPVNRKMVVGQKQGGLRTLTLGKPLLGLAAADCSQVGLKETGANPVA